MKIIKAFQNNNQKLAIALLEDDKNNIYTIIPSNTKNLKLEKTLFIDASLFITTPSIFYQNRLISSLEKLDRTNPNVNLENLIDFIQPFMNQKIKDITRKFTDSYIITNENYYIPFSNLGDGIKKAMLYYYSLTMENSIILIEEPENFLHPKLMDHMYNTAMLGKAKEHDDEMLLGGFATGLISYMNITYLDVLNHVFGERNKRSTSYLITSNSEGFGFIMACVVIDGKGANEERIGASGTYILIMFFSNSIDQASLIKTMQETKKIIYQELHGFNPRLREQADEEKIKKAMTRINEEIFEDNTAFYNMLQRFILEVSHSLFPKNLLPPLLIDDLNE